MPALREELGIIEAQSIIRKVTEPTAWVHPMVTVLKKGGGIRVCVDFRRLNEH